MEQGVERSERSWEEAKEARRRGGERREGDLVDEGEGAKILSSKTTVLCSVPPILLHHSGSAYIF